MSKCRTAFEKFAFEAPDFATMGPYDIAVLAWNARGKVDAEICRELHHSWHIDDESGPKECADAIEKENEQ